MKSVPEGINVRYLVLPILENTLSIYVEITSFQLYPYIGYISA